MSVFLAIYAGYASGVVVTALFTKWVLKQSGGEFHIDYIDADHVRLTPLDTSSETRRRAHDSNKGK